VRAVPVEHFDLRAQLDLLTEDLVVGWRSTDPPA